jgi:hypothetical protein
MQFERVFEVMQFLPDGESPTDAPEWAAPDKPTFLRGQTAIDASRPACTKFRTTFSGLKLRVVEEGEPFREGGVWLAAAPIESEEAVIETPITPVAPKPEVTTMLNGTSNGKLNGKRAK